MLNIDLDGVVFDFEKGILDKYGKSMEDFSKSEMSQFWKHDVVAGFYQDLEPIPEGLLMVDSFRDAGIPFRFLTSTGGGRHHLAIGIQKLVALSKIGYNKISIELSTGIKTGAESDILIDDRQKVLDEWPGHKVLFTRNWEECVNKVTQLLS